MQKTNKIINKIGIQLNILTIIKTIFAYKNIIKLYFKN